MCFVLLSAFSLGAWRAADVETWETRDRLLPLAGHNITFIGRTEGVDRQIERQRIVVTVDTLNAASSSEPYGRLLVFGALYPNVHAGDVVEGRCRLRRPQPTPEFRYDEFLALSRIGTTCRASDLHIIRHQRSASAMLRSGKQWARDRLSVVLPEPQASLAAGIVLGADEGFSPSLAESFRASGLSHLVAVSGYNVTIVVAAILGALLRIGVHRRHATWMAFLSIAGFVVLTGASAATVRAGIMGCLVILARHVGSVARPWYALLAAVTVMVATNPPILLWDPGFHLSVAATAGLLRWSAPIEERLSWFPGALGLRSALATTLAATVATLPIILFHFGRLSLVSPIANLLALPVIPVAMALTTAALVPFVGAVMQPIIWLPLTWVIAVAEQLARMPWSTVPVDGWSFFPFIAAAIGVMMLRRTIRSRGNYGF